MGRDKASLPLGPAGLRLACHLGHLLASVAEPTFEVGPGSSRLPSLRDGGGGPLGAISVGWQALSRAGWRGDVLVLATDLPLISGELLAVLAQWPAPAGSSVVPRVAGRLQPLAARWSPQALEGASRLVAAGERRVQAALAVGELLSLGEAELERFDLARELADVDDPADLARLGLFLEPE